jgi:predicted  nucleic acid-binding Zn-ribbon protein
MTRAEPLYRLQLLDTEMDQAARTLREVESALAANPAVEHARAEFSAADKVRARAASRVRSLELDAKGVEEKVRDAEERLYSGKVRSPKELLDLQRDIDMLKRQRAELDEALLAAMLEYEESNLQAGRCQEALAEATRHWEGDCVQLRKQRAELQDRIAATTERKAAIHGAIPPSDMSVYAALRAKKPNGVAVSLAKGKACGQCGEAPSSMLLQQARAGETLVLCPNCGRILYSA